MKQHRLVSQPLCQARAEIQMNTSSVSAGVVRAFLVKKRMENNLLCGRTQQFNLIHSKDGQSI